MTPLLNPIGSLGIGIIASYRRLGIGKKLLQTAIQKAQQKGFTRIELVAFNKR
ncbi:MAG: GNAT family N-acetyltransferase [Tatlockia sp.]